MDLFNATEVKANTESSIAFLEDLLAQQKQILALQQELECVLLDAASYDPLDQEWTGLQRQADLISDQLVDLIPSKVDGSGLKARDLVPVLVSNLNAPVNTLISVHCGTPQPGTHCGVSDGEIFIC